MNSKPLKRDPMTGEPAQYLFTARDNRGHSGAFDYYRAGDHVFIGDVPPDLGRHYAAGYQAIPSTEAELAALAEGDAYRLDFVREQVPSGSFLEIGPWIGLVAYSAYRQGYDVSVLEINQDCCDLLTRVSHGAITATQTADPAQTLSSAGKTYDVIGLWHAIEHLPRPWDVIDAAAKALNPGGVLLIAAPNPNAVQFRAFGRHWLHLDAPRHLHLIPIETFEAIGERNGLRTILRTTDDRLGEILDDDGWRFEMNRRLNPVPLIRKLQRFPLHRIAARLLRRNGRLDGAGFTLMMQRPPAP